MTRRTICTPLLLAFVVAGGCKLGGGELTDQDVERYIAAYKALRKSAPGLARNMAESPRGQKPNLESARAEFAKIEEAIKATGLKDYATFVRLNAKIGMTFSLIQGQKAMATFQDFDKFGGAEIKKQINDPKTPAAMKAAMRQRYDESKKAFEANFQKNEKWARMMLKAVSALTDEHSAKVVLRHFDALQEAYVGVPIPRIK